MKIKLCPLIGESVAGQCVEGQCALWFNDADECIITYGLGMIGAVAKDTEHLMKIIEEEGKQRGLLKKEEG